MGRLSNLKPQVASLKSAVAYAPDNRQERDQHRAQRHWRKWYHTARWRKLRWSILLRDKFTCQRCGRIEGNTSQLVANHKHPHKGDEALFWSDRNLETACKRCHDSVIQSEERKAGW